ncbi:MAG: Uma2 family endonuclease [Cyanobacteria bacterium J06649_4]
MVAKFRWKSSDLELLPEDGKRYEIIDGELLVTHAPHWGHQKVCVRLGGALEEWSINTGLGETSAGPGLLFTEADNVIPDLVWIRQEKLPNALDESGHLIEAPDLVVEVLSLGANNQQRDRNLKLRLYSAQGVREYWIVDWRAEKIEIYRRESAQLTLQETLYKGDVITSPMLPEFSYSMDCLFVKAKQS